MPRPLFRIEPPDALPRQWRGQRPHPGYRGRSGSGRCGGQPEARTWPTGRSACATDSGSTSQWRPRFPRPWLGRSG